MQVGSIAVDGLRSAADETLAVMAAGLIFSGALTEDHLVTSPDPTRTRDRLADIHQAAHLLLAACGSDISRVGKIKATLQTMRMAADDRIRLQSLFGAAPVLTLVGGEPCRSGAGLQLEFIAAGDIEPRRVGDAVRLGPLAFASETPFGSMGEPAGAGDLSVQAELALSRLLSSFTSFGCGVDDIVKINNSAASWHCYGLYNAVYEQLLSGSQAARCSVGGAGEHPLSLITVEGIAAFDRDKQFVDSAQSHIGRPTFRRDPRTSYRDDIARCKGPHTHGARASDLIFIAGECPYDADDVLVGAGDIELQTRRTLETIEIDLDALGSSLADIVKVNVTLSDARLVEGFDTIWRKLFGHIQAACCVTAAPLGQYGILVEIEAIAVRGSATNRLVLTGVSHV